MAGNDCPDAGDAGSRNCCWKRFEVYCALWGNACSYLGSHGNEAPGGQRVDVCDGSLAESGVVGDASHQPGDDAGPD